MIMTAHHALYVAQDHHDAPDGGACYLMAYHADATRTHHERMVTIGTDPVVTWSAIAADSCPSLDGPGVFDCLGCHTHRRPGLLADAHAHAESHTGGA
ncbi:hypothetical protein [Nonomuraea basaltis]|uniref:hypothetical protein n=1 Tax=Nonomuraea basaltis TaxID=2495887 RepID=UPI00110C6FE7|nr:hypothetical protein [Nonomuraea basaltis]TMR90614.1 hypothetical protein EJK15_54500 [Nonomuraea basaltis]